MNKTLQRGDLATALSVFFLCLSLSAFAQTRTITGKVSTESGETLPGVNVGIKGTTTGQTTDVL